MRTTTLRLAALAGVALLAACNQQSSTTTVANTTEVTPTETSETGSVSDSMVTNIDAAAPTGGAEAEIEPMGNAAAGGNAQ
jgi:uncharacterized lipoprotein YajG